MNLRVGLPLYLVIAALTGRITWLPNTAFEIAVFVACQLPVLTFCTWAMLTTTRRASSTLHQSLAGTFDGSLKLSSGFGLTSEACRSRWLGYLSDQGVDFDAALRMTWTAYPFDDGQPMPNRRVEKAIRKESRSYHSEAIAMDHSVGHHRAIQALRGWATLAEEENEHFYARKYRMLLDGTEDSLSVSPKAAGA
jgi:hypothetical protein